jgi:predicted naringenin-chalcone synthase
MTYILSLGTAEAAHSHSQEAFADIIAKGLRLDEAQSAKLRSIFLGTRIQKRHSVIGDFVTGMRGRLFSENYPDTIPGMSPRNDIFKEEAPKLAQQAAEKALAEWGGDRSEITHVISASCTGMIAPGIEYLLIDQLGLRRDVERLGVNFMGCFGAFTGLSMARALSAQDPKNRVLLVCTELCSLHFQADTDIETMVGNALFADGSAAAIVGEDPSGIWRIAESSSCAVENTLEEMTWEASDVGYLMRLTAEVPQAIYREIKDFATKLLGDTPFSECDWPLHPGGKAILIAIQKACGLAGDQLKSSWEVLKEYGNMSSATFLFVLDRLRRKSLKEVAVGFGFGPGLSLQGIKLERA